MKRSAVFVGVTALTMTLAVNAAEWFNADIGNYTAWPVTAELTGGAWDEATTGGAMLTGTAPAAKLELDADEPLSFKATDKRTLGDDADSVSVRTKVQFNPFNSGDEPTDLDAAKAGIIVVKSDDTLAYYGLSDDGETKEWVELVGAMPDPAAEVEVVITVKKTDDGKVVNYAIDGVTLTLNDEATTDIPFASADEVAGISYGGCGVVSALDAAFDAPDYSFTVTTPDNAAIDSVKVGDTVLEAPYKADLGAEVTVTWKATDGFLFADGQNTASQTFTVGKDNEQKFEPTEVGDAQKAKAAIGTQLYLTLNEALKAGSTTEATTITLTESQTTKGYCDDIGAIAYKDLTIDLAGYTLSVDNTGEKEQIRFFTGATVTIKGGTLARDGGASDIVRSYASSLTLEDVTIDATDCTGQAIIWTNGDLAFTGSTTFINVADGVKAVDCGNYANKDSYAMGTLTFDTDGVLNGDWVFAGGTVAVSQTPTFGENAKFYYGAKAWSVCTDADVEALGFAARLGGEAVATGDSNVETIAGEYFFDMNKAVATVASADYDKVLTLVDNVTAAAVYEGAADFTLDLNGKTWTKADDESFALKVWGEEPATVTITGEGKMIGETGFCVWAKTGTVIIENGSFKNNSNDNYAIYANNTGKIVIKGGTFINENTDPYIYNPELKSLNLNVANGDPNCSITVFGGTFTAEPKDDSGINFVAPGYVATEEGGIWTVAEQTILPVAPGGSPVPVEAADETEAISKVELIATSPDTAVVSDEDYKGYFQLKAVKAVDLGGGKWRVFAELKDDIVKAVPETTKLAAALKSIAAGATEVALTGAKPGLYYSVKYTNNVGNMPTADEGDRTPADKNGAVTISTPVIPESAAMFYQIQVNTKPKGMLE